VSQRRKITVVGAGNVGATCAQVLAARDYAEVVLVDIKENLPQGKALDINQMGAVLGYEPRVVGSNGYDETAGSEVVVITAGLPRSPGMSRDDLVATNERIVGSVTEQVVAASPDAVLIVVSNPLDAMCHVAKNVSGFPRSACSAWPGSSTRAASARSSPGRPARPRRTSLRPSSEATATRWFPS
jgi:malate dehydrogenase